MNPWDFLAILRLMDSRPVPSPLAKVHESVTGLPIAIREFEQLQASAKLALRWKAMADRKRDARRKIVLGALVLYAMETDSVLAETVGRLIDKASPRDAALLREAFIPDYGTSDGATGFASLKEKMEPDEAELAAISARFVALDRSLSPAAVARGMDDVTDVPPGWSELEAEAFATSGPDFDAFADTAAE